MELDVADDSNALILPATTKKNSKDKSKFQIKSCEKKQLSKSQKRKLRRLEEEKEKEKLLEKSLEVLQKHTINDDAYSLLLSSQKFGQTETMREKRRREMHFSKVGLELPESEKRTKRKKDDCLENEADDSDVFPLVVCDKNVTLQPVVIENESRSGTFASSGPSQGSVDQNSNRIQFGTESNESIEDDSLADPCKGLKLAARKAVEARNCDNNEETIAREVKMDNAEVDTCDRTESVESDLVQGPPVPPTVIPVLRPKEVENSRKDLPIIMMEQEIMEAINNRDSVIICGETGCGKTTQIPQFLYEAGYGSPLCSFRSGVIGVTQPRRVAVLSTARRVAYELGVRFGKEVGFQVRHDRRIGENSSIKFMTDGILLRELQSDILLKRYSVIILDEAHERSLNTDVLIGMLSRVIQLRKSIYKGQEGKEISPESRVYPLKLILMSATLQVEDFKQIFNNPPVIEIPTRQFSITKHFSKKTELVDYIGEAYKKVLKMHKRLPPGGILVFVTGQREVEDLCHKLRHASKQFIKKTSEADSQNETTTSSNMAQIDGHDMKEFEEALDIDPSSSAHHIDRFSYDEYHNDSDNYDSLPLDGFETESESSFESDEDYQMASEEDDIIVDMNLDLLQSAFEALEGNSSSKSQLKVEENATGTEASLSKSSADFNGHIRGKKSHIIGPLRVLPLYAMLPAAAQLRVFEEAKEGERLVVVATNVAETSLTIPGIKYVVDTGREKVKIFNPSNGMESYRVQWISKASAAQRAGRAGRTGPGHCYCLYSTAALENEFPKFSCPEILKTPVDGVILLLKSMSISKVANFPFPTPPDATDLAEAEKCLKALEALECNGELTPLGKTMAQYPLSPRHSRLLLLAIKITKEISGVRPNLVLSYAVAIAAALSLSNPFLFQFDASQNSTMGKNEDHDEQAKLIKKQTKENRSEISNLRSDALSVAYALQRFDQSENASLFCDKYALNLKTMEEMSKLRKQILQLVFNQRYSGLLEAFSWTYGAITDVEDTWRASSIKNPLSEIEEDVLCQVICAGWPDRVAKRIRGNKLLSEEDRKVNAIRYQASMVTETVFLRRFSSISRAAPDFLVYHEMQQTRRPYIHGATSVKSEWLVKYAGSLCTFSAPLAEPKPFYDPHSDKVFCYVIPYFGPHLWELPLTKVPIKDKKQRLIVFAYALLDGLVLPCLKSRQEFMAALPSSILKPESLCQARVGNLLSKLNTKSRTIDSCAKLREAWEENPRLLFPEILGWFQERFRSSFEELWAKMHKEALLAPQDRFRGRTKRRK